MDAAARSVQDWIAAAGLAVRLPAELACLPVQGMALDSRQVRPGDVFVALRGARGHGLDHLQQALERGASAVLSDCDTGTAIRLPHAVLPALAQHAGRLADLACGQPSARLSVIGVTGTNGKTSSVQFLAQALGALGHRVATQGTLGSGFADALLPAERTTPDAAVTHRWMAQMLAEGADAVAMEVSSHALEQGRVDGVRFRLALFTNLSRDHLDYHGTMQRYYAAKARLFDWPGLDAAVINLDDPWGRKLREHLPAGLRCLTYAIDAPAELRAQKLRSDTLGLSCELHHAGQCEPLRLPLLGRFNLANALGVAAALLALGHPLSQAVMALGALRPVRGRMERVAGSAGQPLVVVDYAHTPDALQQALASLRPHVAGKLWLVFGCGGERDPGKRPLMAAAAQAADHIIVTDDNPRGEDGDAIVADIVAGFDGATPYRVERDRERAIGLALQSAAAEDLVLIAGKGHERTQEIGGQRLDFDDVQVARRLLGGGRSC